MQEKGYLNTDLYKLVRDSIPIFCVDVVLVPKAEKPQVILLYRDDSNTAKNQYWITGGRVRKYESLENAAKRLVKNEINLEINVSEKDQLFTDSFQEKEVHTISTVYIAITPQFEKIRDQLRAGPGHTHFALFEKIKLNWHPYIQKAVTKAWERIN